MNPTPEAEPVLDVIESEHGDCIFVFGTSDVSQARTAMQHWLEQNVEYPSEYADWKPVAADDWVRVEDGEGPDQIIRVADDPEVSAGLNRFAGVMFQ